MRRLLTLLLLVVGAGATLLLTAGPAAAHATVTRSDPADGADLARAPASVSITFDEPVGLQPGYVQVVDDTGRRVDTGSAVHPGGDGTTVSVALRTDLRGPAGYLVSYRVVSADSHPVDGVIRFTVGGGNPVTTAPATARTSAVVSTLLDVATTVQYVGLALAGGLWLLVSRRAGVLDSPRGRDVVRVGLVVAVVATAAQLALQGPYTAGTGAVHAFDGALWRDTLATSYGRWHLVTLGALLVLLAASAGLRRWTARLSGPQQAGVGVGAAVWVLGLVGVAASGHAGVQAPVWLGLPVTTAHVLAMTTWVGGLVVLLTVVVPLGRYGRDGRDGGPGPERVLLQRLSGVALVCVVVLAVTGTYQAWIETRSWAALVTTTYGALVLTKIGLFGGLVGLGAIARRRVRRGDPARALRAGVLVEIGVVIAVLGVTGVLVTEPPARQARTATLASRSAGATATFDATRSARIEVSPAHTGPVAVTVTLDGVATVQSLGLTAALPAARIGPLPVTLTPVAGSPGRYRAEGLDLPTAGRWTFTVTLRTSQFDAVVADVQVTVR